MKILMLSGFFPPEIGGIEIHVYRLSKRLAEMGNEVTVIARHRIGEKPKRRVEYKDGIKVKWIYSEKNTKVNTLITWIKAFFMILNESTDIIHAHSVVPITTVGGIAKLILKKPMVTTIHESHFIKGLDSFLYKSIAKLSLNFPDAIIAVSEDRYENAKKLVRKKIFLIPNSVDTKEFRPYESNILREEYDIPQNFKIILYIGRLSSVKGVHNLIKAIPRVIRINRNIRFVLIGDGPQKEQLLKEIRKLKIKYYIIFTGFKPNEQMPDYYNSADLVVLPSLIEATSITGLEAMACGKPLIGTHVGGLPEIIEEGYNGFLCKPNDPGDLARAINIALNSNLTKLGENSRKIVEKKFSLDKMTHKILEVYKNIYKK